MTVIKTTASRPQRRKRSSSLGIKGQIDYDSMIFKWLKIASTMLLRMHSICEKPEDIAATSDMFLFTSLNQLNFKESRPATPSDDPPIDWDAHPAHHHAEDGVHLAPHPFAAHMQYPDFNFGLEAHIEPIVPYHGIGNVNDEWIVPSPPVEYFDFPITLRSYFSDDSRGPPYRSTTSRHKRRAAINYENCLSEKKVFDKNFMNIVGLKRLQRFYDIVATYKSHLSGLLCRR